MGEALTKGYKIQPFVSHAVDPKVRQGTIAALRNLYDNIWGNQIRSEGYNISLLKLDTWKLVYYSFLNNTVINMYRTNTIFGAEVLKSERWSSEVVKVHYDLQGSTKIGTEYGTCGRYVRFYGILRGQMRKIFNMLAYDSGIKRFWSDLKTFSKTLKIKSKPMSSLEPVGPKKQTLNHRMLSLFTLTLALLLMSGVILLIENKYFVYENLARICRMLVKYYKIISVSCRTLKIISLKNRITAKTRPDTNLVKVEPRLSLKSS